MNEILFEHMQLQNAIVRIYSNDRSFIFRTVDFRTILPARNKQIGFLKDYQYLLMLIGNCAIVAK